MTDDQLVAAFETCTVRNEEFHHTDHVRMGFLYMCRFPVLEGMRRFSEALQRLAVARGKPNLYHETITWAFLLLVRERLARWVQCSGTLPSWEEFATENKDLLKSKDYVLKKYYRDETLKSDLARKTFILPDLDLGHPEEASFANERDDSCGNWAGDSKGARRCFPSQYHGHRETHGTATGLHNARSPLGSRLRSSRDAATVETNLTTANRAGHGSRSSEGIRGPLGLEGICSFSCAIPKRM